VIVLTLLWPALELAIFVARFGRMPPGGPTASLVFLPMGFVSAVAVTWLWSRTSGPDGRRRIALGYVVAAPLALIGNLLGGLVLPGMWGPLVFGGVPLLIGATVGYLLGPRRTPQ
jgi:hypothetical protein